MTKKINSIAPLLLGALGWCATLQASTYHWTGGETTFGTFYVNQHNHDVTHSPTYRLEGGGGGDA